MRTLANALLPHRGNRFHPHALRWQGILPVVLAVLLLQVFVNFAQAGQIKVLSYASDISISGLLSNTNAERSAAGVAPLAINSQLNAAAAAKAAHMIEHDYWAHVAPDGTQPWSFVTAEGYGYLSAGENLAYNFQTSTAVIEGWMNSQGHRENMLSAGFTEVGFGAKNGIFQGKETTVVVAFYAQPYVAPTPAAVAQFEPIEVAPTPEPVVASAQETAPTPTPAPESTATPNPSPTPLPPNAVFASTEGSFNLPPQQEYSLWQSFSSYGLIPWTQYLLAFSLAGFIGLLAFKHVRLVRAKLHSSERYINGHPMVQISILAAALLLVVISTQGAVG